MQNYIIKERWQEVKDGIENQLNVLFDYQGSRVLDFIEEKNFLDKEDKVARTYIRVNPKRVTEYGPDENKNHFIVRGVLLAAEKNVMRTDGIMVESLIGKNTALDEYSECLQTAALDSRKLENRVKELEAEKLNLALAIVRNDNMSSEANRYVKVFPCCKPTIFSLWPPKENDHEKTENGSELIQS